MQNFLAIKKHINNNLPAFFLTLFVGFMLGYFLSVPRVKSLRLLEGIPLRNPDSAYPLINSLLGYDNAEATNFGQLVNLKAKIVTFVNQQINQDNVSQVSVYFRNLNPGQWISVNGDEPYAPASLFKVPLMISYYHIAENSPLLLPMRIKFNFQNNSNNEETIQPSKQLKPGQSYSVDELINEMIINSDNNSFQILYNLMDPRVLQKIYSDMDNFLPTSGGAADFIYIKNYVLFFRILYGSTYLNRADSEKALELLSKTNFKDGLIAPLPKDIVVAHKFGEYGVKDPQSNKIIKREFHDCGIIYYPKSPYLLCVMTKGNDLTKLEKSVSDISKLVYSEVQNQSY